MVRAYTSETVNWGLNSELGQTDDFKIGNHRFPAGRSALKGQFGEQAGKFACCAAGKGT